MEEKKLYVSHLVAWAPGLTNDKQQWLQWAQGNVAITDDTTQPALEFTDALFRRRLSQLSRMTVQTVHDIVAESGCDKQIKLIFASFRGELKREYAIDYTLIDEQMVLPAAFSLSVFNTPIALATIAEKLEGGYSAVYPSRANFTTALLSAAAPVLAEQEKKLLFVYGDEHIPEEYQNLKPEGAEPLCYACILSAEPFDEHSVSLSVTQTYATPQAFLQKAIQAGAMTL